MKDDSWTLVYPLTISADYSSHTGPGTRNIIVTVLHTISEVVLPSLASYFRVDGWTRSLTELASVSVHHGFWRIINTQ